jgi:hypothetical protein
MAPRSSIYDIKPDDKEELDRRLVKGGFSGYSELAEWLQALGYDISKSSVHRYGKNFEERVGALKMVTEQCKAIVEESPDDQGLVNEALIRLTQERVFNLMLELEVAFTAKDLASITRAVANLSRASVSQKRLMSEYRSKVADKASEAALQRGLSKDDANFLRAEILGVKVED